MIEEKNRKDTLEVFVVPIQVTPKLSGSDELLNLGLGSLY